MIISRIALLFAGSLLSVAVLAQQIKPADAGASEKTITLFRNLAALAPDYVMIGHQDALSYGVKWVGDENRSDLHDVTGSHPAVFGWDIGGIDIGLDKNLDSVPFDQMRKNMIRVFEMGGGNTISWHAYDPRTGKDSWVDTKIAVNTVSQILPGGARHADFLKNLDRTGVFLSSLKSKEGELIPLVFRPWHEHSGSWFWWGRLHCTREEYIELFRFTVHYLREKHELNNLLIAYSPDIGFANAAEYLERYPGDDIVDVIGLDDYHSLRQNKPENLIRNLEIIAGIARDKGKIAAFTETGCTNVEDKLYFTQKLLPVLEHSDLTHSISWVLFWRNGNKKHHFMPYKGHKSAADFRRFVAHPLILMQNNVPDLYRTYSDISNEISGNSPE
jgi:mannan endo-1,4-beta-mannosidase